MGPVSRLVTTLASRSVARSVGGAGAGPVGIAIGLALPLAMRTLGPAGLIGMAVGGWAVRRVIDRRGRV